MRGDATKLYTLLGKAYDKPSSAFGSVNGNQNNAVSEKIWAAYGQVTLNTELGDHKVNIVAGVRYEHTSTTSTSLITAPSNLRWDADNDFTTVLATGTTPYSVSSSYDHILPALDFSIDLTDKLKGRVSYGKTIARPDFASLFSAVSIGSNNPNRPTYLGGIPNATSGNPGLLPLVSDNFDVSLEWYFARSSYVSVGFFDKRVKNFVGTGQDTQQLFGLRDPSSGTAGTRSGAAVTYLQSIGADLSDVNLFTMTALIDQNAGNVTAAANTFQQNYNSTTKALSQAFIRPAVQLPRAEAGQQQGRPYLRRGDCGPVFLRRQRLRCSRRLYAGEGRCRLRHHRIDVVRSVRAARPVGYRERHFDLREVGPLGSSRLELARHIPFEQQPRRCAQPGVREVLRSARSQHQLRHHATHLAIVRSHQPDQVRREDLCPHREPALVHRGRQ
jgi:hypothetical protein